MKPTLLVMAAGMGSRYGGLKQIDAVGPNGEAIIDYSIFDAIRAGFGRVVFVIRQDIEREFKQAVGARFANQVPVDYAFQELHQVPAGFRIPPGRKKPWGTAHAMLAARQQIDTPFAVINADDFYGADSYRRLAEYLQKVRETGPRAESAMVGFKLRDTLSDHGAVSRAICEMDANGSLRTIVERTKVEKAGTAARYLDDTGQPHPLSGDELVSMNMFGFTPTIFNLLATNFERFLAERGADEKAEFYISTEVNHLIAAGRLRMQVLPTSGPWFGITYREDKPAVIESIRRLIEQGSYPRKLWS
ncbi:MAG: sugar phosphate nucleotidyltransferase [Verrucomicrobiae bacterium]|nr:sugar phosphate nucleotidyltransferase [Verrucomicrobiae bacterium]